MQAGERREIPEEVPPAAAAERKGDERVNDLGKWKRILFLLLTVGCPVCVGTGEAAPLDFESISWEVGGEIVEMGAADLNGDGLKEIIVASNVYHDKETRRFLGCYRIARDQPQSVSEVFRWEAGPEAVVWDTGGVPGSNRERGVYYLAADGLWLLEQAGPVVRPVHVIDERPLLATGQEDSFLALDFIRDWNGDGKEEVLIPCTSSAKFYGLGGQGAFDLYEVVPVRQFSAYNNNVLFGRRLNGYHLLSIFIYPLIVPTDLDGDGRQDVLVIQGGKGCRYIRNEEGRLEPDASVWDLDIRTADEVIRHRATLSYHVVDLNRDGCADVVVHKVSARFHDWNAETAVFLGSRQGRGLKGPSLRFFSKGFLSGVSLDDLDGDGMADLSIWSVKMGLWPLIDILLRKVINLESEYHYHAGESIFTKRPDYKKTYEFRIETSRPDYFLGVVPTTDGDFNGDGIKDLVRQVKQDAIGIYLGRKRQDFEQDPCATFAAPLVNYVKVDDIDSDGTADLFAYQAQKDGSRCFLWLNRCHR